MRWWRSTKKAVARGDARELYGQAWVAVRWYYDAAGTKPEAAMVYPLHRSSWRVLPVHMLAAAYASLEARQTARWVMPREMPPYIAQWPNGDAFYNDADDVHNRRSV